MFNFPFVYRVDNTTEGATQTDLADEQGETLRVPKEHGRVEA